MGTDDFHGEQVVNSIRTYHYLRVVSNRSAMVNVIAYVSLDQLLIPVGLDKLFLLLPTSLSPSCFLT